MAHDIKPCDNRAQLICGPEAPATTYTVWRWQDEQNYRHERLCDECADVVRAKSDTGELVLVWMKSLSDAGLIGEPMEVAR